MTAYWSNFVTALALVHIAATALMCVGTFVRHLDKYSVPTWALIVSGTLVTLSPFSIAWVSTYG